MYKWRPSKWLKWAPVMAGLPILAAGVFSPGGLWKDLEGAATKMVPDLKVAMDARDAVITGEVGAEDEVQAAVKAVAGVYGVRRAESQLAVVPPVKLADPTLTTLLTNRNQPEVTGTWPEGAAKTLKVTLSGKTYRLGTDPELTSAGGTWTLKPAAALKDGTYDLSVEITDGKKSVAAANFASGLTIDTQPPGQSSLKLPPSDTPWPYAVTGSWPAAEAPALAITLDGKTYKLGTDPELTASGGEFSFAPNVELAPGSYDLAIESGDAAGNTTNQRFTAAIVIPQPEAAPAPQAATSAEPMIAPTISPIKAFESPVVVSGTWDSKTGRAVSVTVADQRYDLNSGIVASPDGTWTLSLPPLADGTYDVSVIVTDAAANNVLDTTVNELVVDLVPPPTPTVNAIDTDGQVATITGGFGGGDTATLKVSIPAANFTADEKSLQKSGDTWQVTLPAPLAPGFYDVVVEATDAAGLTVRDKSMNEITVLAPPAKVAVVEPVKAAPVELMAPTVDRVTSDKALATVTGTWPVAAGSSLSVSVGGITHALGQPPFELQSNTGGKWTLALTHELKNGVYDVVATVISADGTNISDDTVGELEIAVQPPPEPEPKPQEPAQPVPVVLTAPTVDASTSDAAAAVITGTWPKGAGALVVTVDGTAYQLGRAPYQLLASTNGTWKLALDKELKNGTYDVAAVASSADGQSVADTTSNELQVAVPKTPAATPEALAAPTVDAQTAGTQTPVVTGTWPAGAANALSVTVAGTTYKLGEAPYDLLASTDGKWKLSVGKPLADGTYDVVATVAGPAGETVADQSRDELVVAVPPPPPADAPVTYSCNAVLEKIAPVFPIRFEFARTKLQSPYDIAVRQYAALLNDPRCKDFKVEIEGHTDYVGPVSFNQFLSELRAIKIRDVLLAAGVDGARMTAKGFSELEPMDPARTPEARAKNRRVQFRAVQ